MKVVEGDFSKSKELPAQDIVLKLLNTVVDSVVPEGEYDEIVMILNRSDGQGTTFATNLDVVSMNYLLNEETIMCSVATCVSKGRSRCGLFSQRVPRNHH